MQNMIEYVRSDLKKAISDNMLLVQRRDEVKMEANTYDLKLQSILK